LLPGIVAREGLMKTKLTEMFGIETPIFAFSHCRDVVVEVSKAGGLGVLGVGYYTAEQLERELKWIDDHIEGKPYGVDLLMPNNADEGVETRKMHVEDLPTEQVEFLRKALDAAGIPRLPENDDLLQEEVSKITMTKAESLACLETALKHPIKLVVNALGTPPKEMVDRVHAMGIKVGSLVGKVDHALAQKEAGVDLLVAQGSEAGGHTGTISSMILWPSVVDAVAPIPVLAAGGIGRGRHMAAALALGCEGIWCGSIWLGTRQSDLIPEMKERLYQAKAEEAVQSRSRTGKPARLLKSRLTQIWEEPGAPKFLPMPYQTMVNTEPRLRIERARSKEWLTCPIGQIVGDMKEEATVKQVIFDILNEFADTSERMMNLVMEE
jgi:NAD(P)H-dependent flavin oxidoreductase YrpB (nitropropane dioxygenase family)